jgi:hypothetical protein
VGKLLENDEVGATTISTTDFGFRNGFFFFAIKQLQVVCNFPTLVLL